MLVRTTKIVRTSGSVKSLLDFNMNLLRFLISLSYIWLSMTAAAEPQQFDEREFMRQYELRLKDAILKSQGHFACAGIGVLDRGAAIDGPLYYFRESTRTLISTCGGACWQPSSPEQRAMCANLCPPPEWKANDCDKKETEAYWAKRPTLNEDSARAMASSLTACNNGRTKCKMITRSEGGNWAFDITYLEFGDKSMEEWVRRFGKSQIVISPKGQVLRYRDTNGVDH